MDDRQPLRDAAFALSARLRFDELAAAVRADPCDDRAVVELHHWLADVQPRVVKRCAGFPAVPTPRSCGSGPARNRWTLIPSQVAMREDRISVRQVRELAAR
jgi:hypothetical protein